MDLEIWDGGECFLERGGSRNVGYMGRRWRARNIINFYGCGLWMSIMKECADFCDLFPFKVGVEAGLVSRHISGMGKTS